MNTSPDHAPFHLDAGNLGILSRRARESAGRVAVGGTPAPEILDVVLAAKDLAFDQTIVADEAMLVPTLRRLRDTAPPSLELRMTMDNGRPYHLPPPALDISTNDLCGLQCSMCGNRATKRDPHTITADTVRALLVEAAAWGIRRVALTGAGEPFRDPSMLDHIRFANELEHLVTITSNGFPISEKVAAELATRVLSVSISIHGASDETHDRIVGVPTAADHAWRAIARMVAARRARGLSKLSVNVSTVIQRDNAAEMPALVRRAHAAGCDGINIQPVNLQHGTIVDGRVDRRDDFIAISSLWPRRGGELDAVFAELRALKGELGRFMHASVERLDLVRRYFDDSSREALGVACRVGEAFLAIDHRGQIKPCYRLPWSHGDARLKSVRALWNSQAYAETRAVVDRCPLTCLNNCFFREGRRPS